MDSGIILEQNSSERNGSNTSTSYKIPKYADFLFAFSTVKGKPNMLFFSIAAEL